MNKEVTYIEGSNALVLDENNKESIREYSNNLNDILVQENVIEEIEKEIEGLEEKSEEFNKNGKGNPFLSVLVCVCVFLCPFIWTSILDWLLRGNAFNLLAAFNTLESTFLCTFLSIVVGSGLSIVFACDDSKQEERGRQASIEYLKKALEEEKQKLKEMKNEKTKESEEIGKVSHSHITKINHSEEMIPIYQRMQLYYDLGYNAPRICRYYSKHNELPNRMKRQYNEYGQELIREYIEEKGPTLVKKTHQ